MRFYDEVLRNPHISQAVKDILADCVVIDASNVAQYYFEGTDKEHWSLGDFPNIAPPFGSFWLDFDAPKYYVSSETGRCKWDHERPSRWGVHCQAESISEYAARLKTADGRNEIKGELLSFISELRECLKRQRPDIYSIALQGEEYARTHLSPEHF